MRNFLLTIGLLWLSLLSPFGVAQKPDAAALDTVLKKMDETAAHFQTAQADFVFDQYQKVVDETDTQKGTVYYRKAGQQIEMMARVHRPGQKVRAL